MRIEAEGTIQKMNHTDSVYVDVKFKGRIQGSDIAPMAKDVTIVSTLWLKALAAEKLSFGDKFYLTISTEKPSEFVPTLVPPEGTP